MDEHADVRRWGEPSSWGLWAIPIASATFQASVFGMDSRLVAPDKWCGPNTQRLVPQVTHRHSESTRSTTLIRINRRRINASNSHLTDVTSIILRRTISLSGDRDALTASYTTQSTLRLTPPGSWAKFYCTESDSLKAKGTAPIEAARERRAGTLSTEYTREAPRSIAEYAESSPTGPAPKLQQCHQARSLSSQVPAKQWEGCQIRKDNPVVGQRCCCSALGSGYCRRKARARTRLFKVEISATGIRR